MVLKSLWSINRMGTEKLIYDINKLKTHISKFSKNLNKEKIKLYHRTINNIFYIYLSNTTTSDYKRLKYDNEYILEKNIDRTFDYYYSYDGRYIAIIYRLDNLIRTKNLNILKCNIKTDLPENCVYSEPIRIRGHLKGRTKYV